MKKVLFAGLCVVLVGAVADARHLRLVSSFPSADTTLTASPDTIRLTYSQATDLAVSRVRVESKSGDAVKVSRPVASDDAKTLTAAVEQQLGSGAYTIRWSTAGDDGHVLRGSIDFAVRVTAAQ